MANQMTIPDDRFIAFRVRFELKRQKRSQAALARDLDVTEHYLSRRVRGEVPFSAAELVRVAEALDVDVTVFFPQRQERAS